MSDDNINITTHEQGAIKVSAINYADMVTCDRCGQEHSTMSIHPCPRPPKLVVMSEVGGRSLLTLDVVDGVLTADYNASDLQ